MWRNTSGQLGPSGPVRKRAHIDLDVDDLQQAVRATGLRSPTERPLNGIHGVIYRPSPTARMAEVVLAFAIEQLVQIRRDLSNSGHTARDEALMEIGVEFVI